MLGYWDQLFALYHTVMELQQPSATTWCQHLLLLRLKAVTSFHAGSISESIAEVVCLACCENLANGAGPSQLTDAALAIDSKKVDDTALWAFKGTH